MLIDSEKLKEELVETDRSIYQTSHCGINLQTTLSVIDHQKEVGGWQTGTPTKKGWYACICDHGIETKINNYYTFPFERGKFKTYDYIRVIKWYKLPPYERGE